MHEYSIVQALMRRVEAEAASRGATAVTSVLVQVGELAGVDVELLTAAFRTLARGTTCEQAVFEVSTVPAVWACRVCGRTIERGGPLRCRACDSPATLRQGDDMLLERLEIDVEGDEQERADVRDARA